MRVILSKTPEGLNEEEGDSVNISFVRDFEENESSENISVAFARDIVNAPCILLGDLLNLSEKLT
jgi:hypothetical protein